MRPTSPLLTLILWLVCTATIFIVLFIFLGLKIQAVIVCVVCLVIAFGSYFREIKANQSAIQKRESVTNGDYFRSPAWKEAYLQYKELHPFEHPQERTLKDDLFRRYRRKESFLSILMYLILLVGTIAGMIYDFDKKYPFCLGVPMFGWLLIDSLNTFTGKPVRKWLKHDIDYPTLETSYQHGSMLTYKGNGFNLGTTHIHAYTPQTVYAIDYELVKSITRKMVRAVSHDNTIFDEEYKHFAVIHVRLPESGNMTQVEIELNPFQVEMILDEFARIKGSVSTQNEFTVKYDS
ncbi:MAG: hypothetical protein V3G42_04170 [Oscillospiraceae bacterium]